MRLCDSSNYNPDIEIDGAVLEVTPPGFSCSVFFELKPRFSIVLNSSNLKIQAAKSRAQLACLPDGVYKIRYSINPNTKLYVEYDLLRNTMQLLAYYKAVCDLYDKRDRITHKLFEQRRTDLMWIRDLVFGAKYKVEECCQAEEGINMYNEANRLLVEFNNCKQC